MHKVATPILAVIFAGTFTSAFGAQQTANYWTGTTGNWSHAPNWSTSGAPQNGGGKYFNAEINGTDQLQDVITFDALPTTVDVLSLGTNKTLQNGGGSGVLAIGDNTSPFANTGTLNNAGTINWGNGGLLQIGASGPASGRVNNDKNISITDATLVVNGDFTNANDVAILTLQDSDADITGTLTNAGIVKVTGDGALIVGSFANSGGVSISADSEVEVNDTYVNQASVNQASASQGTALTDVSGSLGATTYTQTGGTTTVEVGAVLATTKAITVSGGMLQGLGTVIPTTGFTLSGGTLQPGLPSAPGTLILTGSYEQTGGVFSEQIADATTHGLLAASGSVTLAGASGLAIHLLNGFTPVVGETFDILNAGAGPIVGGWANAPSDGFTLNGLNWQISYGSHANLTFEGIDLPTSPSAVLTLPGQRLIYAPPSGTLSNPGTVNLQQTTSLTISGNLINAGTINTGNGASDTGSNLLIVSGNLSIPVSGGISLNAPGDKLTTNGLSTSGSLVVENDASVVDNGNFNNSGNLTIEGCLNCDNVPFSITGQTVNTGTIDLRPQTFDEVIHGGLTLQAAQDVANSGDWVMGLIDALIVLGPTEVPDSGDPSYTNLSGGSLVISAAGDTFAVTDGSFFNDAGATVQVSGGNDRISASNAFVNAGTVALSGSGDEIDVPSFDNSGTVTIGAGETVRIEAIGANPASGYTQSAGITFVNGSLISSVVTVDGGTLRGHGTISGAVANKSGVVEPGGSIGTLTVASYAQGANGTLAIEVSPATASQLNSLGAASLDGTLALTFDAGTYGPRVYKIVASAPLTGTFSTVLMSGLPSGVSAAINYQSSQVELVTEPTAYSLAYGALSTATLNRAQGLASTVESALDTAGCDNGIAHDAKPEAATCDGMRVWGQAFGASDHAGPAIERFTNNGAGVVGGIDRHWGEFGTLGAAFGYASNDLSMKAASSSASGQSYFGSLYGRWTAGGLLLDAQGFYMWTDWPLRRASGAVTSNPNGDTEGFLAQASVPIDDSLLRPYVRYAWAQFHRNATMVAGVGAPDFIVRGGSSTSSLGEMGIIIDDTSFDVGSLTVLSTFRIGAQEDFTDRNLPIYSGLADVGGSMFTVDYVKPDRVRGVVDATVKAGLASNFDFTAELRGRFGSNETDVTASLGGVLRL